MRFSKESPTPAEYPKKPYYVSIASNAPSYDAFVDYRDASEINWD